MLPDASAGLLSRTLLVASGSSDALSATVFPVLSGTDKRGHIRLISGGHNFNLLDAASELFTAVASATPTDRSAVASRLSTCIADQPEALMELLQCFSYRDVAIPPVFRAAAVTDMPPTSSSAYLFS